MEIFNWATITLSVFLAVIASGHALFHKRTPPSALGWVAVCLMFPFFGAVLYYLFGINRVETRARKLEDKRPEHSGQAQYQRAADIASIKPPDIGLARAYAQIARISDVVTHQSLVSGNRVDPFHSGEEAYPAMLESIASARDKIYLITYIFDLDKTGRQFIDALARAVQRGVDVRVIIDGVGELMSLPWFGFRAGRQLKQKGIRLARFLRPRLIPPAIHINLRNHRKLLIADGRVGYTGGMNIGDRHLAKNTKNPSRVIDMHFRLTGPIVIQLEQSFLEDWAFCTGEQDLASPSAPEKCGNAVCRAIKDGPNEDVNKLATILNGAIASARRRIDIMTPYFLPSTEMMSALQIAALRGIEVNIVLPSKNNMPFIQWASHNLFSELLYWGVRIYYQPPPFVHTKLFVVDDQYVQIGSANLDARSLRLNFEFSVEIYNREAANRLSAHIHERISQSTQITLQKIESRHILIKTRDALTWLFSPYL